MLPTLSRLYEVHTRVRARAGGCARPCMRAYSARMGHLQGDDRDEVQFASRMDPVLPELQCHRPEGAVIFFELIRKTDVETRQVGYAVYAQVAGNHAQGLNEFRAASKSSDLLIVHFQRTIALVTIATPAINMSYVSHNSLSHKLVGQGYTGHNHASHYQHI